MGVSVESSGRQGRKSVDAELNLIPFIDLLSVCILFLLMTAVWVQISKMSALSQPSGEATISHSEVSHITQGKETRDFDVIVKTEGVEILSDGRMIGTYPIEKITEAFASLKTRINKISNPKFSLRAEDDVAYADVITVLDTLFTNQWTNVSIGGVR